MKVDVIVALGRPAIKPAFEATRTIPIVMIGASADPVGDGFATSLARPGGNVTGVIWSPSAEVVGKLLAFLKEAIPGISRVALLNDGPIHPTGVRAWNDAGAKLQIKLQKFEMYDPAELESTIDAISRARAEAVFVGMSAATYSYRNQVVALALARGLPAIAIVRELPEAGGLLSYGPNNAAQSRSGAAYVDKILKGVKPGDLPINQPSKFDLVINLKTANALNITIPRSLLQQADHVN